MAWVQPIVGHLLSQYKETVLDGLQKVVKMLESNTSAAGVFISDPQALQALFTTAQKHSSGDQVTQTIFSLLKQLVTAASPSEKTILARALCGKLMFPLLKSMLADISESRLQVCLLALSLLSAVSRYCPKIVLNRFGGSVPLQLPCFRLQLPFGVRRIRDARLEFLISIATTKHQSTSIAVVSSHGYLTQLLEDGAEVLRQGGDAASLDAVQKVLGIFEHQFLRSTALSVEQRRDILNAQRNIFRILVKALTVEPIADRAADILQQLVDELIEPSRDYAVTRQEADDRGMPNFMVFNILRLLRPKNSSKEAALACMILHKCPDLIRPFFVRASAQLADETAKNGSAYLGPVAVLNLMTRVLMAPLPYHLSHKVGTLVSSAATSTAFFAMTPQNVAEEVSPSWLGEFVHRLINHSTNLLTLLWAVQVTQAALNRAVHATSLVRQMHRFQQQARHNKDTGLAAHDASVDMDTFESELQAKLMSFLPSREEFWHRVTQQLHKVVYDPASSADSASQVQRQLQLEKGQFVLQRMMLLMETYTSVFQLRTPWLSAIPSYTPRLDRGATIHALLSGAGDVLEKWTPKSVSSLCSLLCSNLARGVTLAKLHHINLGTAALGASGAGGGTAIAEWPALLSIVSWFIKHRPSGKQDIASMPIETLEALAYVCRLCLFCVHAVSMRYAAEMDEVFLWLSSLTLETAPMFLHMLNLMLMRGTSKAAERVAAESLAAEHGVLVESARMLLARAREKQVLKTDATAAPAAKNNKAAVGNAWQLDLESHLDAFEAVVKSVEAQWAQRAKAYRRGASKMVTAYAASHHQGRRQLELAVLATTAKVAAHVPLHEAFVKVLCEQVPAEDAIPGAQEAIAQADAAQKQLVSVMLAADGVKKLAKVLCTASARAVLASIPSVAWSVLQRLSALLAEGCAEAESEEDLQRDLDVHLPAAAQKILAFYAHQSNDWNRSDATGMWALILVLLQSLLRQKCRGQSVDVEAELPSTIASAALVHYTGTLSVPDRLLYAVLLHVHYLESATSNMLRSASRTEGAVEAEATDDVSDASESGDDDGLHGDEGAVAEQPTKQRVSSVKKNSRARKGAGEGAVLAGCLVPKHLQHHRFATSGVTLNPAATAEVDVLAQLLDGVTDAELQRLDVPLTLTTTVYVKTSVSASGLRSAARGLLPSVWRAVFPDVLSAKDRRVMNLGGAVTADDVPDPRYLLPLLQTVGAIAHHEPQAQRVPPHLVTRCFPVALRGLSSSCGQLRMVAATVLALSTPYLSPTRRSLLNFARLKSLHLEMQLAKRGVVRSPGAPPLRLPTPLTAFLLAAQIPIQRYHHPLHNNVVNVIAMDTKQSLTTAVPLADLLSSFPLGCITHQQMRRTQEGLLSERGGVIAAEGSKVLADTLQATQPLHLDFMLQHISHSCQGSVPDAKALIYGNVLSNIMALATMLSSTPVLRLRCINTLSAVCTSSGGVAEVCAVEGQVLPWLGTFVLMHIQESSQDVDEKLGSATFLSTLRLMRLLVVALGPKARWQVEQTKTCIDVAAQRLTELGLSSKAAWDAIEALNASIDEKRQEVAPRTTRVAS